MDLLKIAPGEEEEGESSAERLPALRFPDLRPYLPDAHLLRALCRAWAQGSAQIVALTWRWIRSAPAGDRLLRGTAPLGAAVVAVYAVRAEGPMAVEALLGAWVLAAAWLAPRTVWRRPPGGEPPAPTPAAVPGPTAPISPGEVARAVREIAVPRGWAGAHITTIAEHLGVDRDDVLDALAEAGITVAAQLKLRLPDGRQGNRQGVRLDALPPGLGEAPSGLPERPAEGSSEVADRTLPEGTITHPHGPW